MSIKVFADGADIEQMHLVAQKYPIAGFTTNPTLCRKAGIKSYLAFAERAVNAFPSLQISLEVVSDEFDEMVRQARKLASLGENVYVKIPVSDSHGETTGPVISGLVEEKIKVNVTAIFTYSQVNEVYAALRGATAYLSIFAGRIADTGRNPAGVILHALKGKTNGQEVIWASPRQVFDVYLADALGCDIITCTPEIIAKLSLEGKNLVEYSRETVAMFHRDAKEAGYTI